MILGSGIGAQIVKMRREGLSIEQIGESLGIDVAVVAMALEERGAKEEKNEARSAIEEHKEAAIAALGELVQMAENEGVRAKAAMYIADVALGLKEPRKDERRTNTIQINVLIQQARSAYEAQLARVKDSLEVETLQLK